MLDGHCESVVILCEIREEEGERFGRGQIELEWLVDLTTAIRAIC